MHRIVGDDVDHAGDRVEAEQGGVGTLDDLDLAYLVQFDGQRVPLCAADVVEVDLLAVEQDEEARIAGFVVAAHADIGGGETVPPHIDSGHELQDVRDVVGTGTADVVGCDDLHIRRHLGHSLRLAGGGGGHRFAQKLFESGVIDRLAACRRRKHEARHKPQEHPYAMRTHVVGCRIATEPAHWDRVQHPTAPGRACETPAGSGHRCVRRPLR